MRVVLIVLGVLLTVAVFAWMIVARLPAGYLMDAVIADSSRITWSQANGTMWQGSARIASGKYDLGTLAWSTETLEVFPPRWKGHVELSGAEVQATSKVVRRLLSDHVTLQDATVTAPANWIQHILNAPFLLLGGELRGDVRTLELADGRLHSLQGQARWVNASIDGRIRTRLGEIEAVFSGDGSAIVGELTDRNGPLSVAGTVRISPDTYSVDLTLKAPAEAIQLRQALEVLGRVQPNGELPLRITGPMIDLW